MSSSWQPTITLNGLRHRANILHLIRQFFKEREVLEVETPLLSKSTNTSPYIESFRTHYTSDNKTSQTLYLQTSPEFAMKRLLAANSGPIYQITHAFRNNGEQGRWHNPEFTMLEWYRPGFSIRQLMSEAEALLQVVLHTPPAQCLSYAELFKQQIQLDPHHTTLTEIKQALSQLKINAQSSDWADLEDTGLQIIAEHLIHHHTDNHRPLFLYDFPVAQAALAQIKPGNPAVAERFEIYYKGLELANGFHELADPLEQKERFLKELGMRERQQLPAIPVDERLLEALHHGLPDCSGIAVGLDRLIALASNSNSLAEIIAFPMDRA